MINARHTPPCRSRGCAILLVGVIAFSFCADPTGAASYAKRRIIVTTDITNEPDDQQSLIRLLVYSNDYDIEGLIASTGIWKPCDPATEAIHQCIDAYAKVRENLVQHDPEFPTAEYLHSVTRTGNRYYGMSGVRDRGSPGAELIIKAVDKPDP